MIQRLYVHNFRCLENFEFNLANKLSVLLIGKNGSGKSIGSALEIFQKIGRGTNRMKELVTPADFSMGRSQVPLRLEIQAAIAGKIFDYKLALELPEQWKELRVVEENLSVDGSPVLSRELSNVQIVKKGNKSVSFSLDWHNIQLPLIQEQSSDDPVAVFRRFIAQILVVAPIPALITGDSETETLYPNRWITNLGDWFAGLVAQSPAVYSTIDKHIREIMPDFAEIRNPLTSAESRRMFVTFQQKETRFEIPFRDLSDGEKCFFVCAAVLAAIALARGEKNSSIMCFWDEPDNYLAPDEIGHFVLALRRSFQQGGGQLIATSHNPEAIRQFSNENTFLVQRNSHVEPTILRPLSELSIKDDLIETILRGGLVV
jgi:energy-coupling factor transporter ATP-binding protein EcfA2